MKIESGNTHQTRVVTQYTDSVNKWPIGTYISTDGLCSVIRGDTDSVLITAEGAIIDVSSTTLHKKYIKVSDNFHIKSYEI